MSTDMLLMLKKNTATFSRARIAAAGTASFAQSLFYSLRVIFVCAVLSTLAACSFIPDYTRPDFSASTTWNELDGYPTATVTDAKPVLPWQEFYQSPQLQEMIAVALENNKDLNVAVLNIEAARAQYGIQRSELFPTLGAGVDGSFQRSSEESSLSEFSQRTETYSAGLNLSTYELDVFGRIRSLKAAALNEFLATRAARDVVQNALIAELSNAYLQLLADQKLLALTKKTLEAQQKTYFILTRSKEVGIATTQDVARVETAVETARVNLHQYERFVAQDKNALVLLMGVRDDKVMIPEARLEKIMLNQNLSIGLPSEVLLMRPDVRQAELELLARNADIGAARAAFFPKIQMTGDFGFASQSMRTIFNSNAFPAWSFVPQISVPIFTAGRNQANLDLAEIRKDQAILNYEKSIQVAFKEVSDELAAKATYAEQLKAQNKLVAAAQRVYDVSYARYKYGIDNFLSVLDSQRDLYAFEQNEILIERQQLSNLVQLYKALGGGSYESYAEYLKLQQANEKPVEAGKSPYADEEKLIDPQVGEAQSEKNTVILNDETNAPLEQLNESEQRTQTMLDELDSTNEDLLQIKESVNEKLIEEQSADPVTDFMPEIESESN